MRDTGTQHKLTFKAVTSAYGDPDLHLSVVVNAVLYMCTCNTKLNAQVRLRRFHMPVGSKFSGYYGRSYIRVSFFKIVLPMGLHFHFHTSGRVSHNGKMRIRLFRYWLESEERILRESHSEHSSHWVHGVPLYIYAVHVRYSCAEHGILDSE